MRFVGTSKAIYQDTTAGYHKHAVFCAKALDLPLLDRYSPLLTVEGPNIKLAGGMLFTMWEPDEIPADMLGFKKHKVLIVPSDHNKKLFRKYFRGPIEVCPLFVDTTYSFLPPARPFRFICVARESGTPRKNVDQLIACFTKAFPTQPDVELTIKLSPFCRKHWTYDKRINIIYQDFDKPTYDSLLAQSHCGVFLSGAEAWNLPACELAAMGRPSILIPLNGPVMFTDTQTSWHLPYKLVKAPQQVYKGVGKVGRADDAGIIRAMQEAYEDSLLLAQKAIASAQRAADFTEARFAARLRSIVARYEEL
jgi:glycosyltransferase involved in cell wall biosynthesis